MNPMGLGFGSRSSSEYEPNGDFSCAQIVESLSDLRLISDADKESFSLFQLKSGARLDAKLAPVPGDGSR